MQVRLQNCIFDRNTPVAAPTLLAATPNATQKAFFYSDASSPKVCDVNSASWALEADQQSHAAPVKCAYGNPKTLAMAENEFPGAFFLTADNEWFERMMEVCHVLPVVHDMHYYLMHASFPLPLTGLFVWKMGRLQL